MCIYFSDLTPAQQATVRAIFEEPPQVDVSWHDILELFNGLNYCSAFINADAICISIKCQNQAKVGIFNCIDGSGYASSHMIRYLRDMLSDVGGEPH